MTTFKDYTNLENCTSGTHTPVRKLKRWFEFEINSHVIYTGRKVMRSSEKAKIYQAKKPSWLKKKVMKWLLNAKYFEEREGHRWVPPPPTEAP